MNKLLEVKDAGISGELLFHQPISTDVVEATFGLAWNIKKEKSTKRMQRY